MTSQVEEILSAIGHLKCCKAAGESDILPELLMSEGLVFVDKLVGLFDFVFFTLINLITV